MTSRNVQPHKSVSKKLCIVPHSTTTGSHLIIVNSDKRLTSTSLVQQLMDSKLYLIGLAKQ